MRLEVRVNEGLIDYQDAISIEVYRDYIICLTGNPLNPEEIRYELSESKFYRIVG
jgi:hypothetical protein